MIRQTHQNKSVFRFQNVIMTDCATLTHKRLQIKSIGVLKYCQRQLLAILLYGIQNELRLMETVFPSPLMEKYLLRKTQLSISTLMLDLLRLLLLMQYGMNKMSKWDYFLPYRLIVIMEYG